MIIKPWFSHFGNISVVTSRNSKYLRKFAFLFNMENFDSWGNFLITHPSGSKLGSFSNWHQEKLQHCVRFLSWWQSPTQLCHWEDQTHADVWNKNQSWLFILLVKSSSVHEKTGAGVTAEKEQSLNGKCCVNEFSSGCFKAPRILIKEAQRWLGESLKIIQSNHTDEVRVLTCKFANSAENRSQKCEMTYPKLSPADPEYTGQKATSLSLHLYMSKWGG